MESWGCSFLRVTERASGRGYSRIQGKRAKPGGLQASLLQFVLLPADDKDCLERCVAEMGTEYSTSCVRIGAESFGGGLV